VTEKGVSDGNEIIEQGIDVGKKYETKKTDSTEQKLEKVSDSKSRHQKLLVEMHV